MQSGCPQSHHGGVSPVCHQDRSNNGALTSADIPAHETQHMFASQPPRDDRVGYHPSDRQHCFTQAPQNVPALHHREDVQTSSLAAGFQHAVPTGDKLSLPNSCQQMSREANHFVATDNEHASRQSVVQFSESSRKISNGYVSISCGECSNTNNTRLTQIRKNPALSDNCSSAGLKGISRNSTSGIHPQHGCTNISCTRPTYGPEQSLSESQSLLKSLLSETASTQPPNYTPANSALASLGQGSFSNSHEHGSQPILTDDQILDFIKIRLAYYKSQIKRSNGGPDPKEEQDFCFSERHSTLGPQNQFDCRSITPKADSVAHPPAIFDHLEKTQGYSDTGETEGLGFKQFFTYGDEVFEEDKSKKSRANAESPLKLKAKNDCAGSTPEKDSREYRQIMMSVAATCTKTEDENPVVLTAVSGMTLAELVEKQPTSRSQEEYESVWLNVNKSLDDIDKEPGVCSALRHIPDNEEGTRSLKPVEAVEFNHVQVVTTDLSKGLKAISRSVLPENKTTEHANMTGKRGLDHEKVIPPASENQIHNPVSLSKNVSERRCKQTKQDTQNEDVMEDADSVYSQTVFSTPLSENKCEQVPLSRGSANLKDPQYDDITDDESPPIESMNVDPELSTHLSDNKDKGSSFFVCCKVPQYEDITEDESSQSSENQDVTVVPQSITPLSEFNTDKSPPVNQDPISVGELIPKKQVIQKTEKYESAQVCSCPYYVETDDGFEKQLCPKCETERQLGQETNLHSRSIQSKVHGGSLVLIPVSPPTSAPLSNDRLSSEEEGRMEAPKESAIPTVAGLQYISVTKMETSQYEVMIKNDGVQYQKVTDPSNLQKLKEPHHEEVAVEASPQNEDVTVDYFQCESKMEDEREDHWMVIPVTISDLKFEPPHVNQGSPENVLPQHDETGEKPRQDGRIPTGSELHQSASKPAPASTTTSTTTTNVEVFETLDSFLKAKALQLRNSLNYPMSAESEKGHSQSKDQEAVTKTAKSTPSLELEPKSELHTHWSRRQSSSCETEDSSDYSVGSPKHNYMTVSRKCWDKRPRPKTHVRSLSSEGICAPASESLSADGKFTNVKKQTTKLTTTSDTDSSDDSDCVRKTTHRIKSKSGSDHIRHKTKRQKSSKKAHTLESDTETKSDQNSRKKAKKKRLFSGSGDSSDDLLRPQNRPLPETVDNQWPTAVTEQKPHQTGLSEELTLTQSVDRVESLSTPNPVIPRLVVEVPSGPTDCRLKLSKQPTVHKQGKDETPTKTNRKNNSSIKKHTSQLQRRKEKYFKAASSRPHQKAKESDNGAQNTAKNCKSLKNHSTQDVPSTSRESSASIGEPLSTARDSSAFPREHLSCSRQGSSSSRECLSESKHSRSISKVQRSYSSKRPSTSVHPSSPTKYPPKSVTVIPSAKQQVRNEWQNSFYPTRRDKKISQETEEDLRMSPTRSKSSAGKQDYDAGREARLGPSHFDRLPRQRHNSESFAPLMKKSMSQAKIWTQARHQEPSCQRRPSVGEGYKWAEKTPSARKTMGSRAKWRKNRSFSMPQR